MRIKNKEVVNFNELCFRTYTDIYFWTSCVHQKQNQVYNPNFDLEHKINGFLILH